MKRAMRAVAAMGVAALLAAGCGDDGGNADPGSTTSRPAANCGGTVSISTYTEPKGLDPIYASGATTAGLEIAALYDPLVRWDAKAGTYVPWLAESFASPDGGKSWELKIRDKATFANGDPITAQAVKASIERHKVKEKASLQQVFALLIDRIDTPGERTLIITLAKPWSGFPFVLAGPVGQIMNVAVADAAGASFGTNPRGAESGPFVFDSFKPGEEIRLRSRPDYWGGAPCVDGLRFIRLVGAAATYDALKTGTIDIGLLRDPKVIDQARNDSQIDLNASLANLGEVILMNNGVRGSKSPTADRRVRQAIVAAIDVDAVNQRASDGKALATKALIHPTKSIWSQGLSGPKFDVERAKSLVAEAKASGWNGSIRLACDNAPNRVNIGLSVATQLRAVGFTVELDTSQPIGAIIQAVVTDANYDLACWGMNAFDDSPWAKINRQLGGTSSANFAGFINAEWDAALATLSVAEGRDQILAALRAMQTIADEQAPVAVLSASEEVVAWRKDIRGLTPTTEANVLLGAVTKPR